MAAWCMPAADDRERAVAEVAQVYERIKIQQPLLFHHYSPSHQLAQSLLTDALRALNVALSVMKRQQQQQQQQQPSPAPATPKTSVVKAEPQLSSPSSGASLSDPEAITSTAGRGKRRRTTMEGKTSSWAGLTIVPYEDGYEWRKYGEKKINGTSYTRSYFRCTYKDDTGCLATKHVQQKNSSDPPLFQVTYNNKHTCNNCTSTTTKAANSSERLIINSPLINNGHHASMGSIKQEPPVLPPLAEASAFGPFNDQTPPCQQETSFPIGMQQQPCGTTITSTTSSCISGESCHEYRPAPAGDMAAEASPGYDLLYEELSLLCDSFKVY